MLFGLWAAAVVPEGREIEGIMPLNFLRLLPALLLTLSVLTACGENDMGTPTSPDGADTAGAGPSADAAAGDDAAVDTGTPETSDVVSAPDVDRCGPAPAAPVGEPPCKPWVCERVADVGAAECWSCDFTAVDDGLGCEDAETGPGLCVDGFCEPHTGCDDRDPCTRDFLSWPGLVCDHGPLCDEPGRTVCAPVGGDAVTCVCSDGFMGDGEGGCVEDDGAPVGDACGDARPLPFGAQTLVGDLTGFNDGVVTACVGEEGAEIAPSVDQVWTLTVDEPALFTVKAWAVERNAFQVGLSLSTVCGVGETLACDAGGGREWVDGSSRRGVASLERVPLGPGIYTLVVEAGAAEAGAYELWTAFLPDPCAAEPCRETWACTPGWEWGEYTCDCPDGTYEWEGRCEDDPCAPDPCAVEEGVPVWMPGRRECIVEPPAGYHCACPEPWWIEGEDGRCEIQGGMTGDRCETPFVIQPDELPINVTVDLPEFTNDTSGFCGGHGQDAVFLVPVLETSYLYARASGTDTVLHIRSVCADKRSELEDGCNDDNVPPGGGGSALGLPIYEPGVYYVFLDAHGDAERRARFELELRPDPCADGGGCNPDQECVRSNDWVSAVCVCPEGTFEWEDGCVDDPCDPDPCLLGGREHMYCDPILPSDYTCSCWPGFVEDGDGCVPDDADREWTVMVYLDADNDLEPFGHMDMNEMMAIGSDRRVAIVVQMDYRSGPAERLYVSPGESHVLERLGEVNMGSADEMARFGEWAVANYPARRYALVLWNHGSGWHKSGDTPEETAERPRPPAERPLPWKGFAWDDSAHGSYISIASGAYGDALERIVTAAGQTLDFVGFDACLMGMWEVAYATDPWADQFIASEETIPGTGWPYDRWLAPLLANPDVEAEQLGRWCVDAYADDSGMNATLSLVDMATIHDLVAAIDAFAAAVRAAPETHGAMRAAIEESQRYAQSPLSQTGYPNVDLQDIVERLLETSPPADVKTAALVLIDQIGTTVTHNRTRGTKYERSHGLATYIGRHDFVYAGSTWGQAAQWDELLLDLDL